MTPWYLVADHSPEVINHHPVEFTSVEELDTPERYLQRVKDTLDGLGVKWCFAFGSALGLYRHKGFVPCDTDVDVLILADEIDSEGLLKAFPSLTLLRTVRIHDKYHQIAFQGDDKFIVDLWFFYRDGDKYVSFCEGGHWVDDVATIGDFTTVATEYGDFPVPEKIEDYLVARYGDWKTPRYGENGCSIKA